MAIIRFGYAPSFDDDWYSYGLTDGDKEDLESSIVAFVKDPPENNGGKKFPGTIISGVSGAYKIRFASEVDPAGKSGGYRLLYIAVHRNQVYFLTVFAKGDKANITAREKNDLRKVIKKLKERLK
ncbi:type II toxin-antitoxin system RelE/ParE family toxin [Lacticaseibacillus parahuelsenbergensis]|uniref:Type II toxin-antitoxin system RelE/ParE family toxin n=1 Tax=Lacticaseibacillus parahuelsenbergensis TaxID=3068305 RepID=A0ABY9L169_9LACO|nr:type II toxin-antitoxin system RelE/ParE family toxin [Lacticaseibacillus sp. NCIMB 15471]WLV77512.1 type II toxin-antitoxin system RelE/ParE family toxin [Lacticaseibacillus sp. NCIMB 15471]